MKLSVRKYGVSTGLQTENRSQSQCQRVTDSDGASELWYKFGGSDNRVTLFPELFWV